MTYGNGAIPHTDYQQKDSDAKSGDYSLHFYSADGVNFKVEQKITGLKPGYYNLSMFLRGGNTNNPDMYLYAKTADQDYKTVASVNGWVVWSNPDIQNILVKDGTITIGANIKADGGAWGTLDDFYLYRTGDLDTQAPVTKTVISGQT